MGRKVQQVPCAECTQKCRFFHGKERSSSPVPTSFFKIMLGDDFSSVLYIPPKFSRTSTVSALLNKKIILKDSSGKQWEVALLIVDGSFAFKDGWDAFSSYHGLKVGDFVLFNYIHESYFDVLIFDKSGCERLDFSKKRNQKKRNRDRSGSPVRDGMLVREGSNASVSVVSKPDVPKMKSQPREVDLGGTQNNTENISKYGNNGSAPSVCIAEHCEDPCYMTSRDLADKERDDKSSMFDVLDCEIWNNCGVDGTWKITTIDSKVSHVDHGSHVYQNDAIVCNKDPLFEGILGRGAASDKFELSGRNNSLRGTYKSAYDKTSTLKLEENIKNNSIMSNREVQKCQIAEGLESDQVVISKKKHALHIGGFHNTKQMFNGIPNISDAIHNGEMLKMTRKKHVDMTPNFCSFKDKLRATGIKKEPVDMTANEKDALRATGEMSKPIKKVHVDMTPNVYKDEFPATVKMSKRIKKELEDMTPYKYKDELSATGLSKVKGELGQSFPTFNQR